MKKGKFYYSYLIAVLCLALVGFTACSDDDGNPPPKVTTGYYVLSEGEWGGNNAQIGYYDIATGAFTKNYFNAKNSRALGGLGQDIKRYGSKIYCTVSESSLVEVMNEQGVSLRSIAFQEAGKTQPRYLAFSGGKAYVTLQDGYVARIDTATYAVDYLQVGPGAEGICLVNNKLYVTNSGYYPTYNNTVSVIDVTGFTVASTLTVGLNPYWIDADASGNIFISTRGNYTTEPALFQHINPQTGAVTTIDDVSATRFVIVNNLLYGYYTDWLVSGSVSTVFTFNTRTRRIEKEEFITDGTVVSSAYGMAVNPLNGDVLVGDAFDYTVDGTMFCFDKNGKKKYSFETGMGPNSVLFITE